MDEVSLAYGVGGTLAVKDLHLKIDEGEFVAVVGPSGCGKSSLMKLVSGLVPPTEGAIVVAGKEVSGPLKIVGMAFQNPTMLPWLTIRQNIMLPLKIVEPYKSAFRAKRNGEFRERAEALLAQVGLGAFGDKRPWQLSGGMLQRASLCRALIHEPSLLMLDEPFGALDQFTREDLWAVLQDLWMAKKPTVILVTHDLREATYLANRILVMKARPGRIIRDQPVPFARPRTIDITYANEFADELLSLRHAIFDARGDDGTAAAPQPGATP
ncbi:MAG TPA: ABC transporter ATP-binding protein [Alphaproteobacteria bacterium]|nr:ABC transporter ATP-binding protein [Alphaproteobacteria bacterium]